MGTFRSAMMRRSRAGDGGAVKGAGSQAALTMASVVSTPPLRAFRNALIKKNARAHLFELGTLTQSTCTRFLSQGLGLSRFGCLAPLAEGVLCAGRGLLFAKSPKKPTPKTQVTLSTQKKYPN